MTPGLDGAVPLRGLALRATALVTLATCLLATPLGAPRVAGAATSAEDPVTAVLGAFVRDLHAKAVERSIALYAPDAVFVEPNGHEVRGTSHIRALYETVAATYDSELWLLPQDRRRRGDTALESGTYRERLRLRKSGAVERIRGRYAFVLARGADRRWRIARVRWTVDAEPARH